MKTVHSLMELATETGPVVLAVGFFDGVHKGHQSVIAEARQQAGALGGHTWVLTFDPHPLKVIRPEDAPAMLTSTPHKLRILDALGVDGCILLPFTPELRQQEPEVFIEQLCRSVPGLARIVVGENWAFGHDRRGSSALLAELAGGRNIGTTVVPPVLSEDEIISSTRVRQAVKRGDLPAVSRMLGRHFSVWGDVVQGRKIGRELGFPTANIDPHNEVHLPNGIYAVYALFKGQRYNAAAYIGECPTFDVSDRDWVVEVYLFDVHIELHGEEIEVFFVAKLREDRRFPDADALKAQIARDVEEARRALSS